MMAHGCTTDENIRERHLDMEEGQSAGADKWQTRLARLRAAVARRDWAGIAIELLVVTLGVLLAFQIDQWGQDRRQAREERQLLIRIWTENQQGLRELDQLIAIHERGVAQIGAALRAANAPHQLKAFAGTEGFGCVVGTMPAAAYNDTAFQEMVNSGRLNLISDPDLRAKVRELSAAQAAGSAVLANNRQWVQTLSPIMNRYYKFTLGREPDTRCSIDWPAMMANREAANAAARAYRLHQLMLQVRSGTRAATLAVQADLACRLGKRECGRIVVPPRPDP